MGRIMDILEKVLECIADDGAHILDEDFMMEIFSNIYQHLPLFLEYYTHIY